jgi:hypothetical protein
MDKPGGYVAIWRTWHDRDLWEPVNDAGKFVFNREKQPLHQAIFRATNFAHKVRRPSLLKSEGVANIFRFK